MRINIAISASEDKTPAVSFSIIFPQSLHQDCQNHANPSKTIQKTSNPMQKTSKTIPKKARINLFQPKQTLSRLFNNKNHLPICQQNHFEIK